MVVVVVVIVVGVVVIVVVVLAVVVVEVVVEGSTHGIRSESLRLFSSEVFEITLSFSNISYSAICTFQFHSADVCLCDIDMI